MSFVIIRHRKENLKKCSLRGLEGREGFLFLRYPECLEGVFPSVEGCILLDVDGSELVPTDQEPLILLDATWKYATQMRNNIPQLAECQRRRLPDTWRTAYPRYQTGCSDPERGLASIEALYVASLITGRSTDGLLDGYYWKDQFLEKNNPFLDDLNGNSVVHRSSP